MFAPSSDRVPRRLLVGVGASLLFHVLLVLAILATGRFAPMPTVKRGEPLFVELPNVNEPAPRGNPAAREPGAPVPVPAPAAPPRPSSAPPVPRAPATSPAPVVKSPSIAPPAPRPPSPPAPAPSSTQRPTVAEKTAPPPPDRVASAPTPDPVPAPAPRAEDAAPAPETVKPPPREAMTPPPSPSAGAESQTQEARTSPPDGRTAMLPPSGSRGSSGIPDMRTALRRGSGAGGLSEGRGGIEGEAIPLDSRDPRYSDYLDRIRRMIKAKWGYPCIKNGSTHECEYKSAVLVIEFGIARDGKVPFVTIRQTSGFQIYDDYAVNAIKFAQPFPRVPDTMGSRAGVPIVATFSYQVDTSLVNLLR